MIAGTMLDTHPKDLGAIDKDPITQRTTNAPTSTESTTFQRNVFRLIARNRS